MSLGAFLGLLSALVLTPTVVAADRELAADSTLEGILRRGELRVGFEAGYMPFQMIDKRGGLRERSLRAADVRRGAQQASFIGFDIDIAREMAKALGVRFVPVHTQWSSIIPALDLGRFDIIISGMSATEERQQRVDFAEPYMSIGQTILLDARHGSAVKSYRDLDNSNYTVASKPGTTGEEAVLTLMPNAGYRPFDTETEGAMAVVEGEVDAFVYDLPFNAVFSAMHESSDLLFLDQPFTRESLAWAIRKQDPDFIQWLNRFLAEIKSDGRYARLYEKWFKRQDWFAHVR
jgi:polar amino acid transport system substrate-binding protein